VAVAIDRPQAGSDHARMPTLLRFLLLLLLAGASTAVPARQQAPAAASSAPAPAPDKVLDQLRGQLDDIQKAVDDKPDTRQTQSRAVTTFFANLLSVIPFIREPSILSIFSVSFSARSTTVFKEE